MNLFGKKTGISKTGVYSINGKNLSPINECLYRYERYASTNHMKIDPDAGTFEDLKELHEKANENGIKVILDIALNHCSSDNPIFQEALKNPNSKITI